MRFKGWVHTTSPPQSPEGAEFPASSSELPEGYSELPEGTSEFPEASREPRDILAMLLVLICGALVTAAWVFGLIHLGRWLI